MSRKKPIKKKTKKLFRFQFFLLGIFLLPCIFCSFWAILQLSTAKHFINGLKESEILAYFLGGILLLLISHFLGFGKKIFLYLYVLGHELTHALACLLCFRKVKGIKITSKGGHIITSESNFFICLSPYIIPFWTLIFVLASFFFPEMRNSPFFFAILGASLGFHWFWTWKMAFPEQSDLLEYGFFFSVSFIAQVNLLLIALSLSIISQTFSIQQFLYQTIENLIFLGEFFSQTFFQTFN